jgi:hypothetical protein
MDDFSEAIFLQIIQKFSYKDEDAKMKEYLRMLLKCGIITEKEKKELEKEWLDKIYYNKKKYYNKGYFNRKKVGLFDVVGK